MSQNFKFNLIVFIVALIVAIVGVILMFNGINNDNMGLMFGGIATLVLSFLVGAGILVTRGLRYAVKRQREELNKFFDIEE